MLIFGIREGTFLVSEEFAIDGSFRYRAAVDGKVRTVFASRESVNDFREMLLTDTGFSGDEHAQIGTRYLHGYFDVAIQERTLSDDPKTLLNT